MTANIRTDHSCDSRVPSRAPSSAADAIEATAETGAPQR
jgi:hypothetical protein